ncbi:hypothetical protein ACFHWD_04235 [Clostridium sp. MT-14]|uniref:hypothetical protein n=1 Tax=Clostridium sp. MT-14 TaxID=3348360 RepID=UPI0035F396D0
MSMDIIARGMAKAIQKQIDEGQTGVDTFMVKVSSEDDSASYLSAKINGTDTQIKINNVDNTLILGLDEPILEELDNIGKINIDIDDAPDFLENKIIGTENKITVTKQDIDISNKLILNIGKDIFDKTLDNANSIIYIKSKSTLNSSKIGDALDELDNKSEINKDNIENSINNITNLQNNQGKVKLSINDESDYLNNKIDNSTIQIENNKLIVKNLNGLTVPVETINLLQGVSSNIQEQINGFTQAFHLLGAKDTYAQLNAIESPNVGDSWIINADETQGNVRDWYTYTSAGWILMGIVEINVRNFTTNPIDLSNEVTGTLPQGNIDLTGLVKQSDLGNYLNKNTYDKDNNGQVDKSDDSDKLNGQSADYYIDANNIQVNTINFDTNLTEEDNTVQKVLEKVDKLSTGSGGEGGNVDLSNYYNKSQVDTLVFQNSNSAKSMVEIAIGDVSLTTDNTFEEISNTILDKKQSIVNALQNKGIGSATQADDIGSYADKINAIIQNSQIKNTKLNKNTGDIYQVVLTNPADITDIATSVLEYVSGDAGVVQYDCSFNNADSDQFNEADHIIYDGTMHQDLDIVNENMTQEATLTSGIEYSCDIDQTQFREIGKIEDTSNDTEQIITITSTYNPVLVIANGDINLNGVDKIDSIVWTATCENTSKLLLIFSIDSGVTWHGYDKDTGIVTDIDISNNADIEAKGISIENINNASADDLSKIRNNSPKIRFGYYFNVEDTDDAVSNDEIKLTVDMLGTSIFSKNVDISLEEDNKTITYTFNKENTYTIIYCDNGN